MASASPRRQELLRRILPFFDVIAPDIPENIPKNYLPEQAAMHLAESKARHVYASERRPVIAADTIVTLDGAMLGKPADRDEAFSMLRKLSGRTHAVITGICLIREDEAVVDCERTEVVFAELTDARIEEYIDTGEPMDKAGAYGIQGYGGVFVKRIEGCYYNVMGLPLAKLYELLFPEENGAEA